MHNKISLRMLFAVMTAAVVIAALYQIAGRNLFLATLLILVEFTVISFTLFGAMFLLAYPLGRLSKYLDERHEEGQSPFATDRLPTQFVPPPTSRDE